MKSFKEMAENELEVARKKTHSSQSFFWSVLGGNARLEEAAECYTRAGSLFRSDQSWEASGEAYDQAARLYQSLKMRKEAAAMYVESALVYDKTSPDKSLEEYIKAIKVYKEDGRFGVAAKTHERVAAMHETRGDWDAAAEHCEKAADYYRSEGDDRAGDRCSLKIADCAFKKGDYDKAIGVFEELSGRIMRIRGLQFVAIEYLFKALLCYLLLDCFSAQVALGRYVKDFPLFAATREEELVKSLISSVEKGDEASFRGLINEYDSISRLDTWFIACIERIIEKSFVTNKRIE